LCGARLALIVRAFLLDALDDLSAVSPHLVKQAKADFDKRTECFTYKSPIPDMIKEPSGLPDKMRRHGTRSQLKVTILKSADGESFGPHPHGHSHER
jgi:hypothetical protein